MAKLKQRHRKIKELMTSSLPSNKARRIARNTKGGSAEKTAVEAVTYDHEIPSIAQCYPDLHHCA
jgi:hypothetical protein